MSNYNPGFGKIWIYLVAPLIGGLLGGGIHVLFDPRRALSLRRDFRVAGPDACHLLEPARSGTIGGRFDTAEHRALNRRRRDDLRPAPVLVPGVRPVLLARDEFPDSLEDRGRDHPGEHSGDGAEWLVEQFHRSSLARRAARIAMRPSTEPARRRADDADRLGGWRAWAYVASIGDISDRPDPLWTHAPLGR